MWKTLNGMIKKAHTLLPKIFLVFEIFAAIWVLTFSSHLMGAESEESTEKSLIQTNRDVSNWIDLWAEKLDIYLADRRYTGDKNKTQITIENTISWREGVSPQYKPNLGVKMHLPQTQKKWKLAFTTYDDENQNQGINRNRNNRQPDNDTLSTLLEFGQSFGSIQTRFEPIFQYSDTFETKFRLRIYTSAKTDWFEFKPEILFFANPSDGTGQFLSLGLIFKPYYNHTLEIVNEEQYSENSNTIFTNHGPIYSIEHSDYITMIYKFIVETDNRPTYQATVYTIGAGFNHKLYRNVLHYSIEPIVFWEREFEFRRRVGLETKIDFIF